MILAFSYYFLTRDMMSLMPLKIFSIEDTVCERPCTEKLFSVLIPKMRHYVSSATVVNQGLAHKVHAHKHTEIPMLTLTRSVWCSIYNTNWFWYMAASDQVWFAWFKFPRDYALSFLNMCLYVTWKIVHMVFHKLQVACGGTITQLGMCLSLRR